VEMSPNGSKIDSLKIKKESKAIWFLFQRIKPIWMDATLLRATGDGAASKR
jgi:hypothetical protein